MARHTSDPSFMLDNKYKLVGACGDLCGMCGGPFHPATGSDDGKRQLCGVCVRSFVQGFKDCASPRRKCTGVPFYVHAFPPPPATCD